MLIGATDKCQVSARVSRRSVRRRWPGGDVAACASAGRQLENDEMNWAVTRIGGRFHYGWLAAAVVS
jgi:hypothetical protein